MAGCQPWLGERCEIPVPSGQKQQDQTSKDREWDFVPHVFVVIRRHEKRIIPPPAKIKTNGIDEAKVVTFLAQRLDGWALELLVSGFAMAGTGRREGATRRAPNFVLLETSPLV